MCRVGTSGNCLLQGSTQYICGGDDQACEGHAGEAHHSRKFEVERLGLPLLVVFSIMATGLGLSFLSTSICRRHSNNIFRKIGPSWYKAALNNSQITIDDR